MGVLGGSLFLGGDDDFWAYEGEMLVLDLFFEGGELSVPTWDNFWE